MDGVSPIFEAADIDKRVCGLADEIAEALTDGFLMVVVLKGAFVFAADLIRALSARERHPAVSFVTLSSYGSGTTSSGNVRMIGQFEDRISDHAVLLVDDILDTGNTLAYGKELLKRCGATEVKTCVLLDKPSRREVPFEADFVGFAIDDFFVVGYGIDYAESYRDLPYIGRVIDPPAEQSGTARNSPIFLAHGRRQTKMSSLFFDIDRQNTKRSLW